MSTNCAYLTVDNYSGEHKVGILSKVELQKRFLMGEIIINKSLKNSLFSDIDVEKIESALDTLLENFQTENVNETIWRTYSKTVAAEPNIVTARKCVIEALVTDIFLDKKISVIRTELDKLIIGIKNLDKLKELKNKNGKAKYVLPFFVDDAEYGCFKGANYDLRLGENVYVTTERVPKKLSTTGKDEISIEPGEFGILMTHEYLFVPPDLLGFISVRLTHKQKGLVNISGFHVDPGFYGKLMFSVFNAGPKDVPLRYKDQVFMIMFNELTEDDELKCPKSKWGGMENIPVETLSGLAGSSVSVRSLDKRISRIELWIPIIVGLFSTLLAAVVGWLLTRSPGAT